MTLLTAVMKVAVMFSGGKDSAFAIEYAKSKGWQIEYLLSVKPSRTDCFLFHYATVEHTKEQAAVMGFKHLLIGCDIADPVREAALVKQVIEKNPVEAVLLGGTGLQMTQIKSLQKALRPLGIEVFATHSGEDHDKVMREMIKKGYKFVIAQIASDGLNEDWIGRTIATDKDLDYLFERARKYGFHCGGEGGYYDTFVVDSPLFVKRIQILDSHKVMESSNTGHLVVNKLRTAEKEVEIR